MTDIEHSATVKNFLWAHWHESSTSTFGKSICRPCCLYLMQRTRVKQSKRHWKAPSATTKLDRFNHEDAANLAIKAGPDMPRSRGPGPTLIIRRFLQNC